MRKRRPTIGMLLTTLIELHQVQWLGAVDAATEHDVNLVTFVGRELESPLGFERQANFVYDLADPDELDGLIVWTTALQLFAGDGKVEALCRRFDDLPLVSMEEPLPGRPALLIDNRAGARSAVRHLIEEHGHERIAFVRGPRSHPGVDNRFEGYLEALAEHGLSSDEALVSPKQATWHPEEAAVWLDDLIARKVPVDAIVAANDSYASVVIATLAAHGLDVPGDVAVVGFDDFAGTFDAVVPAEGGIQAVLEDRATEGDRLAVEVNFSATALPLTSVRPPFYALGRRAVEVVLAQLAGEQVPELETLPSELVVRRSCGCFPRPGRRPDRKLDDAFEKLQSAYRAYVDGAPEDVFLRAVDDCVLHTATASAPSLAAPSIELLDEVRRSVVAPPDRADAVWTRVELLVAERTGRLASYEQLSGLKRDQLIRELGQQLAAAPDLERFGAALAGGLPSLRIPSCQLASSRGEGCETLLHYEDGTTVERPAGEPFRVATRPTRDRSWSLVLLPLYHAERQLGCVALEMGPRNGWTYEALREHLSATLETARLISLERDANERLARAIEHGHAVELELREARDDLEVRVAERTAELADANAVLTAQMRERERAEAEQKRLEEQLRQAQKMEAVGRLAGGIAHDFNNMLVVINGLTEVVLNGVAEGDPVREDLEQIQHAGQRAADLTQSLLAFSRQQVLRPRVLDLNRIVGELEPLLQRMIGEGVTIETRLDDAVPAVLADEGQLAQVILNLGVNARDAMPSGGTLTIETAVSDAGARLRVRDTGIGMDDETKSHLFEPFFTTKPGDSCTGTGLGLSTVFGIVQQSGGTIAVASEPGRGTTFDVVLPAAPPDAHEDAPEPRPEVALEGSETILLVEDNAAVRHASRRFLEQCGYTVLEASGADQALELFEEHAEEIELVLTDIVMPNVSGLELVGRLAELHCTAPALFVSGYVDSDVEAILAARGARLLRKPFSPEELARAVRETLAEARSSSAG